MTRERVYCQLKRIHADGDQKRLHSRRQRNNSEIERDLYDFNREFWIDHQERKLLSTSESWTHQFTHQLYPGWEKCEATLRIASRKIMYRESYLKLFPTQVSEEMPMQHQETDRRQLREMKARDARLASPCTEGLEKGECGTSCSAGETIRTTRAPHFHRDPRINLEAKHTRLRQFIFKSIVLEMHCMREADGDETTRVFDGSSANKIPEFARV